MTLKDRISPADRVTALLLAAGAFSAAIGYLWGLIAARFMAPPEYADFTASSSILYFFVIVAAPLSQSVAYFSASRDRKEALAIASTVERRVVGYGVVATLLLCIASPSIARAGHFRTPYPLVAVFVASLLFAILSVRRGVVQGESRFGPLAANTFLEAVFRLTAMLAACFWLPRADVGIATHALAAVIATLLLPFPHTRARVSLGPVWRYLASALGATAMYAAFLNTDVVLARIFFPAADAATYGAASFLARASAMLVTPFYVFAIPHLAEARNDPDDLRRRFLRICAQYTALSAAAVIAIAILRRQLVAVLLGSAYANAQTLLVPISVAIAIGGLAFIVCQLPMTVGSFRFVPWYAAAYVGEIMAVSMWHTTLLRVVYIVIAAQLVALAVIAFHARVKPLAQ